MEKDTECLLEGHNLDAPRKTPDNNFLSAKYVTIQRDIVRLVRFVKSILQICTQWEDTGDKITGFSQNDGSLELNL